MRPLILLMDDNEHERAMLRDALEMRGGYRVLEAVSPRGALQVLEVLKEAGKPLPQAAIVDMYVGEGESAESRAGLGLVQELEERGIPCIVLTAHNEDGEAVRDALMNARFPPHGYLFKSDGWQAVLQALAEMSEEPTVRPLWYRSPRAWIFAVFSAFMAIGLYIAVTTEHAQLLSVVVIGVLIEILATFVLRSLNL